VLGSDVRLLHHHDVRLLSPQDHPGELLRADGRRPADVQRPLRRQSAASAHRARRMHAAVGQHVGTEDTRTGLGITPASPDETAQKGMVHSTGVAR